MGTHDPDPQLERVRCGCLGDGYLCLDGFACSQCLGVRRQPGGGGKRDLDRVLPASFRTILEAAGSDRNLAEFQQALLGEYERQIRLLRNVRYWYLLPPFAGLLLASTGSVMARLSERHPWWPELIAVPVYTAIFGLVWWLNESYAIGQLQRQRARLIEEMK